MRSTAAQRLAQFACALELEDLPLEVCEAAKLRYIDALGCGLAASALGIATEGRRYSRELGEGRCTVIGDPRGASASAAAMANGMLCHGLDFDDTHPGAVAHISTVSAQAAAAAAQASGADGATLLAAIVAGAEVSCRIGLAAAGQFHSRGFHATAICGVFGAAAACARAQGMGPQQATSALGIAGSMASGIFAYLQDGTPTKPIHAGWAAHAGVVAAGLARLGASGPPSVLEGRFGVYDAFTGHASDALDQQLDGLGSHWETTRIALKAYPACHYVHGALHAAQLALGRQRPAAEQIVRVRVQVPPAAVPIVLEPRELKVSPRTPYEAKFSLQYSLAALLIRGALTLSDYTPVAISDPAVVDLARRIEHQAIDFDTYPGAFPGNVEIELSDGQLLKATEPIQFGDARNPMSTEEVLAKFRANAGLSLDPLSVSELERNLLDIDRQDDLRSALAPLVGAQIEPMSKR
jgi:2-methylcitrate dehydratase PrpD